MGYLPDGARLPEGAVPPTGNALQKGVAEGKSAATESRAARRDSGSGMEVKEVLRVPAFYLMLITGRKQRVLTPPA